MRCGYCTEPATRWIEWRKGNWSPGTKGAPVCPAHYTKLVTGARQPLDLVADEPIEN